MRKEGSRGFTLIEVVVAVLIISVVVAALLQLFSNNTRLFSTIQQKMGLSTQASLLLGRRDVGFEKMSISLDRVLGDFRMDDELRQRLKGIEAEIEYREVMQFDGSDFFAQREALAEAEDKEVGSQASADVIFEIGRTSLRLNGQSMSFLRLRL